MRSGEKIRARRENLGWTLENLAEKLGVSSKSYISNLEKGHAPMTTKLLTRLASALNCEVSELADDEAAPAGVDMRTFTSNVGPVPVLGVVAADRFAFSFDVIPEDHIPNPFPGKDVFALRISGNCMETALYDGEYIYLSRTQPVTDGKIVLARLDGQHTLKRYFKRANGIELRPDNKKYKGEVYSTNKLEIVAVGVGKYGKL